jgi:hypothetical protein
MTHRNAPLTPEGRRRLIERCRTGNRPHAGAPRGPIPVDVDTAKL